MLRFSKRFRSLGALAASIVMLVTLAAPAAPTLAAATTPDQAHVAAVMQRLEAAGAGADKVWATLSQEDQQAVVRNLTPASVEVSVTDSGKSQSASASTSCRWAQVQVYYKNLLGQKLVAYFQKIDWCYNGSTVTSHTRTRWGETYALFWQFKGHTGSVQSGGNGHSYYQAWTQGEFALCLPYVGCGQYKYPWISMTVYGNGGWRYSHGG